MRVRTYGLENRDRLQLLAQKCLDRQGHTDSADKQRRQADQSQIPSQLLEKLLELRLRILIGRHPCGLCGQTTPQFVQQRDGVMVPGSLRDAARATTARLHQMCRRESFLRNQHARPQAEHVGHAIRFGVNHPVITNDTSPI